MNSAIVTRVLGSVASGGGDAVWRNAADDEFDFLKCNYGFYWLLANIRLINVAGMADEELIEWDADLLTPKSIILETRTHTHPATVTIASYTTSTGPRLWYQYPFQWWAYGPLADGQELRLSSSHECEIELIAIRHAVIAHAKSMNLELR